MSEPNSDRERSRDRTEELRRWNADLGIKCPVHVHLPEPCEVCSAYIAAGL